MTLEELIDYFRQGGDLKEFYRSQSLDMEAEVIEIYMTRPFRLDKELAFFEIEKTEGKVDFIYNKIKYSNLFDFFYFMDVIEELREEKNRNLLNKELAKRLLSQAIHDA